MLVVKINSHAAVRDTPEGPEYGWLDRYGGESACCGTLAALMEGTERPPVRELAQLFAVDGRNRVDVLHDMSRVPVEQRALLAAVTNARLQAHRAVLDIKENRPRSPTMFLVLPCVTINRPGPDTEIFVGQYGIDWTRRLGGDQVCGPRRQPRRLSRPPCRLRLSVGHQRVATPRRN